MRQKKSERVANLCGELKLIQGKIGDLRREYPGWWNDLWPSEEYIEGVILRLRQVQGDMESVEKAADNLARKKQRFINLIS